MKLESVLVLAGLGVMASAAPTYFNATSNGNSASTRDSWLLASGITGGTFFVDFESDTVGTNLNGVNLVGGLTITHPSGNALVQSLPSFFGSSNPIGQKALALGEGAVGAVLTFANPVDYVGGYDIDKPAGTIRVTLTDNSVHTFSSDITASGGESAEFWGIHRASGPAISLVEFISVTGGDGEWGLDNLEYGPAAVPEPATMTALGLGLLAVVRRRRKN